MVTLLVVFFLATRSLVYNYSDNSSVGSNMYNKSIRRDMKMDTEGIVKQALNAASLRQFVASVAPKVAIQRLGKAKYERIAKEIEGAASRYAKSEKAVRPEYAQIISSKIPGRIPRGAYYSPVYYPSRRIDYDSVADARRRFKRLFPTVQTENGLVSRDKLIAAANEIGVPVDPSKLRHSYYYSFFDDIDDLRNMKPDRIDREYLEVMQGLPYTEGRITQNINNAVRNEALFKNIHIKDTRSAIPDTDSINKALDIIKGQNLLEPGTSANKLYRRLRNSKNPKLRALVHNYLYGGNKSLRRQVERGSNAFYHTDLDTLAVSPKASPETFAHEANHRRLYNLYPLQHASEAKDYFTRLARIQNRYKLNIPWHDSNRMHEALVDATRAGGGVAPRSFRILNLWPKHKVNRMDIPQADKEGLLQLMLNYDYPIFSASNRRVHIP